MRIKLIVISGVAAAIVIGLVMASGLLVTFDRKVQLLSPRFSSDGQHILYVERIAKGVTFGPGLEFFYSPAKLHVLSDSYSLRQMDLAGEGILTHLTWTMPRTQFFVPSYRNHLFGYARLRLEQRGKLLALSCKLNEIHYPHSIEHRRQLWYDLETRTQIPQKRFDEKIFSTSWHKNRLHGKWEVMQYSNKVIFLEHYENGRSIDIRILRDIRTQDESIALTEKELGTTRVRPRLERQGATNKTRERLVNQHIESGMTANQAELAAIDDLEDMGLYPKSKRIVASRLAEPLPAEPLFEISDREFMVGMFQDIEKAISSPGKEVRFWGRYVKHRDFSTSENINTYLESHKRFQISTTRGVFQLNILY